MEDTFLRQQPTHTTLKLQIGYSYHMPVEGPGVSTERVVYRTFTIAYPNHLLNSDLGAMIYEAIDADMKSQLYQSEGREVARRLRGAIDDAFSNRRR